MKWLQPNNIKPAPPPQIDHTNPNIHRWENGLVLYKNFITASEEASTISSILSDDQWSGTGKRITRHFGYRFDYTNNGATSSTNDEPLPPYITSLLPRLPIQEYLPDQFTVQYYPPGTGIPPHVDTHSMFREAIYSLSLGSEVPMVFKRCGEVEARRMRKPKRCLVGDSIQDSSIGGEGSIPNKHDSQSSTPTAEETKADEEECESWELYLPPRSLLIMLGPSRYGYSHKIRGRKFDQRDGMVVEREGRYSITMRSVLKGEEVGCCCDYPGVCDARIREEEREEQLAEGGMESWDVVEGEMLNG